MFKCGRKLKDTTFVEMISLPSPIVLKYNEVQTYKVEEHPVITLIITIPGVIIKLGFGKRK